MNPLARYLDPELIQQVSRLDLRARFIVEGFLAGLHSSPFSGFSVEFSEHRKYVHGDEPRTIDWKVFARTDRLFIRQYEAETHLACHLLVDTSASMGYVGLMGAGEDAAADEGMVPHPQRGWGTQDGGDAAADEGVVPHPRRGWGTRGGEDSAMDGGRVPHPRRGRGTQAGGAEPEAAEPQGKLLYAIHLAAALGYLVVKQRDAVGLAVIGESLQRMLPARARRTHLMDLLATLAATQPQGRTGLARGVAEALAQIPHRGLIVLISDLLTETDAVLDALHHIRFRGHDLIVMHVLDAAETQFPFEGTVRLEDPESGQVLVADATAVRARYLKAVETWRAELRQRVTALRGDYVPLDTSTPFDKALVEFLVQRQQPRGRG